MTYWFNIRTHEVEAHDDPERDRAAFLMGPYETEAEAAQALQKAAERTEAWDEEDLSDEQW